MGIELSNIKKLTRIINSSEEMKKAFYVLQKTKERKTETSGKTENKR